MSRGWKLRLMSLGFVVASLGSCMMTMAFSGRSTGQQVVFWSLGAGAAVFLVMSLIAVAASFGKGKADPSDLGESDEEMVEVSTKGMTGDKQFPGWVGLVVGPVAGAAVGFRAMKGDPDNFVIGIVAGAAMGLAAGSVIWFYDYLQKV